MRERRYGAKGERACKPNCKFYCKLDYRYTYKYTYKYLEFFSEKWKGREKEGWCGLGCKFSYKSTYKYSYNPTYKYTYNLTYKYLGFFRMGKGNLWKGKVGGGRRGASVFLGFSWAFAPVANS